MCTVWTTLRLLFHLSACLRIVVESLTETQYARLRPHAFAESFKVEMATPEENAAGQDSFLRHYYEQLYLKPSQQLIVDIPIIDYNLMRLRKCVAEIAAQRAHQPTMLTLDELPLALEFYMQMDGNIAVRRTLHLSMRFSSGPVLSEDVLVQWRSTTAHR